MKPSEILKKSLEERVKDTFKEKINENMSDVKTSQELTQYLGVLQETAKEKMVGITTGVMSIFRNAGLRYNAIYEKFIDEFKDYITGEIKCEIDYGEVQIYFSTSVSNSNDGWDDLNSPTSELGDMIDRFYIKNMDCSAEVAYESKETIIIILKIKLFSGERLPRVYAEILKLIDPTIIDEYSINDDED